MKPRRSLRTLALIGLLASVAPIANSLPPLSSAHAAAGNITGTVYNDKNSNGSNDGSDTGVAGVSVSAYDSAGTAVGTTTTAANGTYTLAVSSATTTAVRIEFTTPTGYQPSFSGSGNATSIQFTTIGSSGVDYAVERPGEFCSNNPGVAAICLRPGTTSLATSSGLTTIARMNSWTSRDSVTSITSHAQTGAMWGLAFDSVHQVMFSAAVLRRHAGLGPKGIAGIYAVNPDSPGVIASWDLSQAPYNLVFSSDNSAFTDASRGLVDSTYESVDATAYSNVGKVGIGDIDVSMDGSFLYVTNLYEKKIHRIAVSYAAGVPQLGSVTSFALPGSICTGSDTARLWAVKYEVDTDSILAGVECSNEGLTPSLTVTPSASTTMTSGGKILRLAPSTSTWTTVTDVDLDYVRGIEIDYSTNPGDSCSRADLTKSTPSGKACLRGKWHAWTDNYAKLVDGSAVNGALQMFDGVFNLPNSGNFAIVRKLWWPQPILADIEVLPDGSLVVGVMDRFGMQMGSNNREPISSSNYATGYVAGDMLILCPSGGTFVQNNADGCTPASGDDTYMMELGGVSGRQSYHEVFDDNFDNGSRPGNSGNAHQELTIGGLAFNRARYELAVTSMDPDGQFFTGGVRFLDVNPLSATMGHPVSSPSSPGLVFTGNGDPAFEGDSTQDWKYSFMKSTSMGDLELLCESAPLQIGNYVWIDADRDGIQDAGETPVAGVTVRLYNASGALVGTAITDAQGRYYFSSNVSEAAAGNGDNVGGGLVANATFTLKLNNSANYASGGPLAGYSMTGVDQTNSATLLDDSIDSDASKTSWMPEIAVAAHLPGANDHTFDVGFNTTTAPVSLGNYVWYDENSDGLQTAGESPVAGVTMTLTDLSGNPVIDVSGSAVGPTTTDAAGHYMFSNLHPGSYKVVITYPTGMQATTANVGSDTSIDSSSTSATSAMIPAGGQDLTLDFGIVPTNGWNAYNATTTTTSTTVVGGGGSGSTSTTVVGGGSSSGSTSTTVAGSGSGTTTSTVSATTTSSIAPATVVPGGVSVGNLVWIDLNKDGIQDVGEPGITGVKLVLRDIAGRVVTDLDGKTVGPTYTDANGFYYFSNLPVGQYEVSITYPLGYTPTKTGSGTTATDSSTDSAISKSLPTPGMKDYTLDFGVIVSAVIQEQVWIDTNGDGLLTNGEKLVPGADVIILNPDGTPAKNLRGDPVTPVQTQADGSFTFKDLVPGQYKVVVVYPDGFKSTVTGSSSETFTTSAVVPPSAVAQSKGTATSTPKQTVARKVTPVVSIGNLVWFDTNKDGFQDPTEKGVAGAVLSVFKADGSTRAKDVNGRTVSSQRTSSNGRFLFTNLPPGAYVVKIVYPSGYRATVAKSFGRAKNSSTDVSKSLNLSAGESDMTLDFGLIREPLRRLPATL